MKTQVLNFLKKNTNDAEAFNTAFALLQKSGTANPVLLSNYNVRGYTPHSLEAMKYDLRKCFDISDLDVYNHTIQEEEEAPTPEPAQAFDQVQFLNDNKDAFVNILKDMNDEQKSGLKLSAQYPFLREKDCPNELKVLVNDAITAFYAYRDAHTELFNKVVNVEQTELTNEQIFEIASNLISNFELNHEIHAELEHYAKTKTILGEHPIFSDLKAEREIENLTDLELHQKIRNLSSVITKRKNKLKITKEKEAKATLTAEIKTFETQKSNWEKTLADRKVKS